jgi:hypothetical protein
MIPLIFLFALIGVIIVAIVLTELEQFGWATVLLLATVFGSQALHVAEPLTWVKDHAVESLVYSLIYVAVGIAWSFAKWFSFLIQFRDRFRKEKERFLTNKDLDIKSQVPAALLYEFNSSLSRYSYHGNSLNEKPRASNNKSRIVSWMSLWPCSVIGTILNDPIRRIFNFLFGQFKALYQRLADHVFRNDIELK